MTLTQTQTSNVNKSLLYSRLCDTPASVTQGPPLGGAVQGPDHVPEVPVVRGLAGGEPGDLRLDILRDPVQHGVGSGRVQQVATVLRHVLHYQRFLC